ncbi:MAG: hypothetical protein K2X93_16995, partial [Candidatus Obscuribacterales bacterium]|nr:hypothetical protein [Candidatus Obscuribacterales bacterium]
MSTRLTFDTDDRNDSSSGKTPLAGPFDALSLLGEFRSILTQNKTNDSASAYLTDLTALFDLVDPIPPSDRAQKNGDNDLKDLTFISANADPIRALMDKHKIPEDLATEVKKILDVNAANGKPKYNEQQALELARKTLPMTRQEPELSVTVRVRLVELAQSFIQLNNIQLSKNLPLDLNVKSARDIANAFWGRAADPPQNLNAPQEWKDVEKVLVGDFKDSAETRALTRLILANPEMSTLVLKALPPETLLELRDSGVLEHIFNKAGTVNDIQKLEDFIDRCLQEPSKLTGEERKAIADVYSKATRPAATLNITADQVSRLIALDPRQIIDCNKALSFVMGSSDLKDIQPHAFLLARGGNLPQIVEALKIIETSIADESDKNIKQKQRKIFDTFTGCFSAAFFDIATHPDKSTLISNLAKVSSSDLIFLLKHHKSSSVGSVGVVEAVLDERFRSGSRCAKEWLEIVNEGVKHPCLRDTLLRIAANLPLHEKQKLTNAEISDFHKLWERLLGNKTTNFEALRLLKSQLEFPEAGLTFPTNLRESLYKEGLKDFLKDLPPGQQARMVIKLLELTVDPINKELVLRCASPEAFAHLDAKTLDLVKTKLETIIGGKENANGAEFLRRVNAVSERRTGQQLDPEFARAILEQFAPEDRPKIVEYLQGRASYCSIAGMDEVFRDL